MNVGLKNARFDGGQHDAWLCNEKKDDYEIDGKSSQETYKIEIFQFIQWNWQLSQCLPLLIRLLWQVKG